MPENKQTTPEKSETPVSKNPETRVQENKTAEKKLKEATTKEEEKPQWSLHIFGATSGGDEKLNMTTFWPTYTSGDGETSITAGYNVAHERPDPNMRGTDRNGVGISINTTPKAIGNGIRKIGNGIRNLFTRKK